MRSLQALNRDQRLLLLSSFLWGFGMSLFLYIQPLYIAYLGASPEQIGLTLGLSGLTVTFLYIPIGLWADRHGRKPVILAGWSLATLSTFAMALAPDWRWLVPAITTYLLSNFAMPAFRGYIAANQRTGDLSWTFAVIASGGSVGSIISPAIGGLIGEQVGLRFVYLIAGVFFVLSTLTLWLLSDQPISASAATVSPKQLLSNRGFIWQLTFIFLVFFAIELGQVMVPKFLVDIRALRVSQIGWLGTIGALGIMFWGLTFGHMPSDRKGSLVLSQSAAMVAGLLLISTPLPAFILVAYFIHGGNYVIRPIVQGRLARSLEIGTLSFGFGLYETAMRMGLAISPLVAGLLYAQNPFWPLYAGISGLSLTLLLTLTLPGRAARPPTPAAPVPIK